MPRVKASEIYRRARQGGYGVGGFVAESLDMVLAILAAAESAGAPVVVVLWQADIQSVGPGYLESIVKHGADQVRVPVAIMLDHGADLQTCLQCMMWGHSAVMIDGSHYPFSENAWLTADVCRVAHLLDVIVEGELGTVRRSFETSGAYAEETVLTDPAEVSAFVAETGVDALAVSVGTESGVIGEHRSVDFARLCAITSSTEAHIVLHGGSGVTGEDVRRAVSSGVTAFRFASEMRVAYLDAVVAARANRPPNFPDTRLIFEPARAAVTQVVLARMQQLGCAGKAWTGERDDANPLFARVGPGQQRR